MLNKQYTDCQQDENDVNLIFRLANFLFKIQIDIHSPRLKFKIIAYLTIYSRHV